MTTIVAPKLTYQDLLEMPDDGKRYELIDGEVYMTPSPNWRHQKIVGNLFVAIRGFVGLHDLGEVAVAPIDVVFEPRNYLQPDLLFIRKERLSIVTTHVEGSPDLAIEVLSPSRRKFDRETKLQVYGRFGVRELWYADPETEVLEILSLAPEGQYRLAQLATGDEALTSAVLPGIPLTPRQAFA